MPRQRSILRLNRGLIANVESALRFGPTAWWLARRAVKRYGALQKTRELSWFASTLREKPPRVVLEIGTAQGGMFWFFCQAAAPDATLISLDLPPTHRFSGGIQKAVDLQAHRQPRQTVHQVLADSHGPETFEHISSLLAGQTIDLLFIDGDHTYDGVRQDFEMYAPLATPGGLIVFHDIVPTAWEGCEVHRFWQELAADPSVECRSFSDATGDRMGGLGIVTAPSDPATLVRRTADTAAA